MLLGVEISSLLKVLQNASIAGLLQGVEEKVQSLKYQLKRFRPFFEDDNNKKLEEEGVREWISDLREAVHDAEDVVEMLLVNAEIGRSSSSRRAVSKSIFSVRKGDIDSIRDRLDKLHDKYQSFAMLDGEQVVDRRTEEELHEEQSQVVGMEDDVEKLLRESILDEKRKGVSMAVVEGMVGIGKTTLAWKIYNHSDVVARFECRAWVTVSSIFSLEWTMMQLIRQLPGSHEEKLRELESEESTKGKPYIQQKLQEMLHTQLKDKTYFIIFDDVWEKEHFESLWTVFRHGKDKSSILLTTRNKYIATYVQYIHDEMKLLDPEKSWELFLMKAHIDKSNGRCPEELEPIGREIVRRCNGLPLAISLVGDLLGQTRTKKEWEQVLSLISSHWGWEQDSNLDSIFTRSDLSYQNLSEKLKSCFLCLAFFKEDAIIPVKTLLHIWIGLGLIQQDHTRMEPEEIGREYLDELINRNMLQIEDFTMDDRVKSCHLHGILREMCLRRANEEICLEMLNSKETERVAYGSWNKSRHCVVNAGNTETLLSRDKYLRSLFLLDVDVSSLSHDYWKKCELLKILHLDGITQSIFPNSLRSFIRLKYLRIRRHSKGATEVEEAVKLPAWLDDLTHLEILDMTGEKVEFPSNDVPLKMKRLLYFNAYCVGGPMNINSWDNIETLKYMRQEDWMKCFSRMEFTCNVRKLGLFIDPFNPPHQWIEVRASLQKLEFLEYLHLRWGPITPINPEKIIPNLRTLTKLKLSGKLLKCAAPTVFPQNLSHLTLAFSGLREDHMAELSKLPNLSYLKLLGNAYKDQKMKVLPDGFPCLKALSLREMFCLKSIDIEEGGMPRLEQLRIQQCPSLQTHNLAGRFAIKHIT